MGKFSAIEVLDAPLDVVAASNQQSVCSAQPLTFFEGVDADARIDLAAVAVDDVLRPVVRNGFCYQVTTEGVTGAAPPVYPVTPGDTVADGSAVLTCRVNYVLAAVAMAGGDFVKSAGSVSGRRVTMAQKQAVPITASGTGNHVALVDRSLGLLLEVTTCADKIMSAGDSVTIPAWSDEFLDPV